MKITEITKKIHAYLGESEPWDNDGVMVELGHEITKIAVCLDATSKNISLASEAGADAIITHHPLIFKPISSISGSDTAKRVICCIQHGLSAAAFHTCLDMFDGGVNDVLCSRLDIKNISPFVPYGRIGDVPKQSFADFCAHAAKSLGCIPFQKVDSSRIVSRVAVVSGSGKDEVREAYLAGADTFLTGEASHAAMIEAEEYGINLVCCGHFETENIVVPTLADIIKTNFPDIEVITLGI